jgi:hypothetical protein
LYLPWWLLAPFVTAAEGEEGHSNTIGDYHDDAGRGIHYLAHLSGLAGLTRLTLNMIDRKPNECYWRSLAYLTTLRSLTMTDLDFDHVGGAVKLTSCQQLTYLLLENERDDTPHIHLTVG